MTLQYAEIARSVSRQGLGGGRYLGMAMVKGRVSPSFAWPGGADQRQPKGEVWGQIQGSRFSFRLRRDSIGLTVGEDGHREGPHSIRGFLDQHMGGYLEVPILRHGSVTKQAGEQEVDG